MSTQKDLPTIGLPMEVQEAMRNHLPQMMNKLLRDELEKGETAIKANTLLTKDIKKVESRLDEHGNIARERTLMKKEAVGLKDLAEETKRGMDLLRETTLEIKLEASERYANKLEGVLAGLVRNTEWRKDVIYFESEHHFNADGSSSERKIPSSTSEEAK